MVCMFGVITACVYDNKYLKMQWVKQICMLMSMQVRTLTSMSSVTCVYACVGTWAHHMLVVVMLHPGGTVHVC